MKKIITLFFLIGALAYGQAFATENTSTNNTQFMSYWFSWGQNNTPSYLYPVMGSIPKGVNITAVAFALEYNTSNKNGICTSADNANFLCIQASDSAQFLQSVQTQHTQGAKVILSTGGAYEGPLGYYPWGTNNAMSDQQVADQYISFIKQYQLDGIDFDVEAGDTATRLASIVSLIKQQQPNLIISLTVPVITGYATDAPIPAAMITLAQQLYSAGNLNYVDAMNYDVGTWVPEGSCQSFTYDGPDMTQNCYIYNAIHLANYLAANVTNGDTTKAKQLVSDGIMIGYDDLGMAVSPQLATDMASWLIQNNYGAVMTWGLSRDQPSATQGQNLADTTGMLQQDAATNAYTNGILKAFSPS